MTRLALGIIILIAFSGAVSAEEPFAGQNLVSPLGSNDTYMMDMDETVLKTWHGAEHPASFAYLLAEGSILRPCRDLEGHFVETGGFGGRIQRINADDIVTWDYYFSNDQYQQHHDIEPMPNGNVLVVAWETKTYEEAVAAGRDYIPTDEVWPTIIAEIEPVGLTGGNIVWEWHIWDHLIQDFDPAQENYGVIADHPELVDINYGLIGTQGDWDHANAVSYNAERDEIVFSCRAMHEFYIIDHSTTIEEAASHTGGNSGKGGDILYRWGNPQVCDRGDAADRVFYGVHAAIWIAPDLPGAGNILVFNNGDRSGGANDYSSVYEIVPPLDGNDDYFIEPGLPFGPDAPIWTYGGLGDFYGGATHCGAFRLPNGNTLITSTAEDYVFEVSGSGTIVWDFYDPTLFLGRVPRYWIDPNGVSDEDVISADPLRFLSNHPNPFTRSTTLAFRTAQEGHVRLEILDMNGRRVTALVDTQRGAGEYHVAWDGCDATGQQAASGIYYARLALSDTSVTRRMIRLR